MKARKYPRIRELADFDRKFNCPVIGTDEAGRGPIAGPVVAGAVSFTEFNDEVCEAIKFIDDSKKFSSNPSLRKELAREIKNVAKYGIAECSVGEIEEYNILQASLLAMKKACESITGNECALVLVDGRFTIPSYIKNQKAVKKGDSLSASIAAASILAKVHRDELMEALAEKFPVYNWHKNKGYPTKAHIEAVRAHGYCEWHRKNFLSKIF